MKNLLATSDRLYDRAHRTWERHASMRTAALLLMAVYIIALVAIDLGRRQLLPEAIAPLVPRSH